MLIHILIMATNINQPVQQYTPSYIQYVTNRNPPGHNVRGGWEKAMNTCAKIVKRAVNSTSAQSDIVLRTMKRGHYRTGQEPQGSQLHL